MPPGRGGRQAPKTSQPQLEHGSHLCLKEDLKADDVTSEMPRQTQSPAQLDGSRGGLLPSSTGVSNQRTCGHKS